MRELCLICEDKLPYFRVRGGPIKLDKHHTLCQACFRNQNNQFKAKKMSKINKNFTWDQRHQALALALETGYGAFYGKDLPDPEDPSDPVFTATIFVSKEGAGTEIEYENGLQGTGLPALRVFGWNKNNLGYLKHWFSKITDDPQIYRANEIKIRVRM